MTAAADGGGGVVLALDTATRRASVAVVRFDAGGQARVLARAAREVTTHSEGLLSLVDAALGEAGVPVGGLAGVACGLGPGSFTGLRIGLATAKGLCLAAGLPIAGVPSLAALGVAGARVAGPQGLVAAVLDARRGEVFLGLFRGGVLQGQEEALPPHGVGPRLAEADEPVLVCGEAARRLCGDGIAGHPGLTLAPAALDPIEAEDLARLAWPRLARGAADHLARLEPRYVRAPDIRPPKRRPPVVR